MERIMAKRKSADYQADGLDKNKSYPDDLRNNIPFHEFKKHPLTHGIIMQAHHLISSKGANNCGTLTKTLVSLNYEINVVNNLVFLPSTLEGACHLSVQVHRGDHKQVMPDGKNYHQYIQKAITKKKRRINNCVQNSGKESPIQAVMDKISQRVLNKIASFELPLSSIHNNFESNLGCCNKKNIGDARKALKLKSGAPSCSKNNNHYGDIHSFGKSGRNSERITYKETSYTLKVGR